jgi:hypothetical protein
MAKARPPVVTEDVAFTPARAYWRQRKLLAADKKRILALSKAVDQQSDLWPYQWAQLMAAVLDFRPEIILELGRGRGNSTAAFTEAANLLTKDGLPTKVVSLCFSEDWDEFTKPRLKRIVPRDWFSPLQALLANVLDFDYDSVFSEAKSCLIFWDAHGFDIAECVLGNILPKIALKRHLVLMHDLSDTRYQSADHRRYGDHGIWKGNNWEGPRLRLGIVDSAVEQAVAILDFVSRNEIIFDSADHSMHTEIGSKPEKLAEMKKVLGDQLFSLQGHWFWFTLNGSRGPFNFPRYQPLQPDHVDTSRESGDGESLQGTHSWFGRIFKDRNS